MRASRLVRTSSTMSSSTDRIFPRQVGNEMEHKKNSRVAMESAMHLLSTIERYLRESGMTASRFGRDCMGDPGFVPWLRRGREPRDATIRRVAAYLAAVRSTAKADR